MALRGLNEGKISFGDFLFLILRPKEIESTSVRIPILPRERGIGRYLAAPNSDDVLDEVNNFRGSLGQETTPRQAS
jgi:hypothetical protein